MPRSSETARKGASPATARSTKTVAAKARASTAAAAPEPDVPEEALVDVILKWLDDAKAEDIVKLDIRGKTSIGDFMLVATGRTDRHVGAIADQVHRSLKEYGVSNVRVEGMETCDWVLVDVGAIIVHIFRPDVREFYNIEKMWSGERPGEAPLPGEATH
jgi:ribosome-associated protein